VHITIITLGSQGDVLPYVALGGGLRSAGYNVRVATHAYFGTLVRSRGLDFFSIAGSPRAIVESDIGQGWLASGSNPLLFARGLARVIEPLVEQCGLDCWNACQGTHMIVPSRLGFWAGLQIAEKLRVPLFPAYLQPFTPTRAFPSPYFLSGTHFGSGFNLFAHKAAEIFLWQTFRRWVNRFRREVLGLVPLSFRAVYGKGQDFAILYGYSPSVLPKPRDWPEKIRVTGYWFLNQSADWQPPAGLADFLSSGKPPVSVGFGSMNSQDPEQLTEIVVQALTRARQRGILLAGWGGLASGRVSDDVFSMESAPHEWLFPRMAAIIHHGGAGTTAASLRAGIPSIITPFFADQMFWGTRVHELGVGTAPITRRRLTVERLADAIRVATTDKAMRDQADTLGSRIRAEDGVSRAVEAFRIHTHPL
jgi:sterol 3beta-glucosyltransferase